MAQKKKTANQLKNKNRALQYSTFAGEFVSVITPFIIMGAVNYEDWFVSENGWKVGLGGALALALLGIAVLLVTKKKEDDKITGGYITLAIGWYAVTFIFVLLASIMEEISTIMFFGGLGILGAFGLDMTSKNFKNKADLYQEAIKKGKENVIKEQVEEDIKKGDIRF